MEWNRNIAIASPRARTRSLNSFLFRTSPISFTKSFIPSTSIYFFIIDLLSLAIFNFARAV